MIPKSFPVKDRFCGCGEQLVFEPGFPSTMDDPGSPDVVYCPSCGEDYPQLAEHAARIYWEQPFPGLAAESESGAA